MNRLAGNSSAAQDRAASARPAVRRDKPHGAREPLENADLLRIQRDLGVALSSISQIRPALRRVLASALALEGIDAGGVYLVTHSTRTVELVAHRGLAQAFIRAVSRYDVAAPMARRVLRGRPVYRNYQQVRNHPLFVQAGFLAVAGFPVRYSHNVIAIMNVASRTCRSIPRFTRTVLAAIAAQIGTVIPRIRTEIECREAQTNLRTLFDTVGDMLFIFDQRGYILEVNQAVTTVLGYPRAQLLGQPILKVYPRQRRDNASAQIATLLAGRNTACHLPLRTCAGAEIPAETRVTKGRWDGQPVLFGIARDMRERIQLEQEIIAINESEKIRLAQDIHDNLMQQLTGIAFMAGAMKCPPADGAPTDLEPVDRILSASNELLTACRRTVQGLAPFAPVEGGMAAALRYLARQAQSAFGCDCRTQCRLAAGPLNPKVATQLYYIAQESIRNACKHGQAQRIDVQLTIRAAVGTLSITDDGSGLPQSHAPQTGMGLRIMAYRADMIGGHLSITPRTRGGTRVCCEFRLTAPTLKKPA